MESAKVRPPRNSAEHGGSSAIEPRRDVEMSAPRPTLARGMRQGADSSPGIGSYIMEGQV